MEENRIDILSKEYIAAELEKSKIVLPVQVEREVISTNTLLRRYADAGEERDMLLLAEEQSGGRGRKGRNFYSPNGTGLYMSLLLHPKAATEEVTQLTVLTAVAAAKALETVTGEKADIKWVNDIWVREKKCVGILTEGSGVIKDGCFSYVIVGIGINVYEPESGFPKELWGVAGSVLEDKAAIPNLRNRIVTEVLKEFMEYYGNFPGKSYLEEYRKRSFLIGQEVRVIPTEHMTGSIEENDTAEECRYATVLSVDDNCGLIVRYEDGTVETLLNGEVSVRRK